MITPDMINDWQASGEFHPLTCRSCRGRGSCTRRDVGNVAGDHHVLEAVAAERGILMVCECCNAKQGFPQNLVPNVLMHIREKDG